MTTLKEAKVAMRKHRADARMLKSKFKVTMREAEKQSSIDVDVTLRKLDPLLSKFFEALSKAKDHEKIVNELKAEKIAAKTPAGKKAAIKKKSAAKRSKKVAKKAGMTTKKKAAAKKAGKKKTSKKKTARKKAAKKKAG